MLSQCLLSSSPCSGGHFISFRCVCLFPREDNLGPPYLALSTVLWASQVVLVVKNLSVNAGDIRDMNLIPGSRISPGKGHCNPLQYSCLENSMDRGAWGATVHMVTKSQTRLQRLSMLTHTVLYRCILFSSQHLSHNV